MNDKDLDILLSEYRSNQPTDFQMQKWKTTVRREVRAGGTTVQIPKSRVWIQIVAASVIGFLIGALAFRTTKPEDTFQKFAQNDNESATVEYIYTKSY